MKKLLTLLLVIAPFFTFAQSTSGVVMYEEKINLHKRMTIDNPDIMAMIPEFKTDNKILVFNPKASIYRTPTKADKEQVTTKKTDEGEVRMVFKGNENSLYRNLSGGSSVELKNFMGRKFLIEGELTKTKWKITGKQKKIGEYLCMQAMLDDTTQTEAWFTPQITVSTGPDTYGDLPGLILEIHVGDDERVITATDIKLEEMSDDAITPPTEGKKVTREKFKKIVEEKMEEMKSTGGGNFMIIRD
ncbi:MAG: GLPGLI family protein [Bacteroidota bacterium]